MSLNCHFSVRVIYHFRQNKHQRSEHAVCAFCGAEGERRLEFFFLNLKPSLCACMGLQGMSRSRLQMASVKGPLISRPNTDQEKTTWCARITCQLFPVSVQGFLGAGTAIKKTWDHWQAMKTDLLYHLGVWWQPQVTLNSILHISHVLNAASQKLYLVIIVVSKYLNWTSGIFPFNISLFKY